MDEPVNSFPFNAVSDPMYYGSTLMFLATAIFYRSPAGLVLTVLVFIEYYIAITYFEGCDIL